jgi:hypothetical protein
MRLFSHGVDLHAQIKQALLFLLNLLRDGFSFGLKLNLTLVDDLRDPIRRRHFVQTSPTNRVIPDPPHAAIAVVARPGRRVLT